MLESIRKYQWLMITVFILLAAGFLFTMNDVSRQSGGTQTVLEINGVGYDQGDVRRSGSQASSLAQNLGLFQMLGALGGDFQDPNIVEFFTNRLVVREAGRELGLIPSDAEVVSAVRSIFSNQETGEFDSAQYSRFKTEILNQRYSATETDLLYPLISDNIVLSRLIPLVSDGLQYEPTVARTLHDYFSQRATVQLFSWDLASFEEGLTPTDEELKSFWESRRANYGSEPLYSIAYAVAAPEYPEAIAPTEGQDVAAIEEAQAPARKAAERDAIRKMNDLWQSIDATDGRDFDALVADAGLEVQTVENVKYDDLPAEFLARKAGQRGGSGASDLQTRAPQDLTGSGALGDVFTTSDRKTVVYKITDYTPSEPLEFEAARENVLIDYKRDKATELLIAKVEEVRSQLAAELESGTSIADAAAKLGLEGKRLENVSARSFIEGEFATPQIAAAAASTNAGSLTEVIGSEEQLAPGGRAMFAFVENRTVEELENREELIENVRTQSDNRLRQFAFLAWLEQQRAAAEIESNYAQN